MKVGSVWDNGGATCDRYTVFYKGRGSIDWTPDGKTRLRACLGMSENPTHPQGFGQHCFGHPGRHNGRRIEFSDLPKECRELVNRELEG